MPTYVTLCMVSFENDLPNAQHIYNQAKAVAVNSSVSRIGEPGERTSYCGVYEEQLDGSLVPVNFWHVDTFGIVREGQADPGETPTWIQPLGAQDAYPLLNVRGEPTQVTYNGATYQNTTPTNTWAPGAFGWVTV